MRVDLARSRRRIKPEQFIRSLKRRRNDELDFVDQASPLGPPLLLDTCVYVDALVGK